MESRFSVKKIHQKIVFQKDSVPIKLVSRHPTNNVTEGNFRKLTSEWIQSVLDKQVGIHVSISVRFFGTSMSAHRRCVQCLIRFNHIAIVAHGFDQHINNVINGDFRSFVILKKKLFREDQNSRNGSTIWRGEIFSIPKT